MAQLDLKHHALVGTGGLLSVRADDEITRKLAMLIEGECEGLGPLQAAKKFGFSKQRYFQLRAAFDELGAVASKSETWSKDPFPVRLAKRRKNGWVSLRSLPFHHRSG